MITSLTRRDLRSALKRSWSGRLTEAEFLSRLYDLTKLPATDFRHENMLGDVRTHGDQFPEDWEDDWIFTDSRLQLDEDARLMQLLTETLHPEVVADNFDAGAGVAKLNRLLLPDGFEIFVAGAISGRPVFSWRRTMPRKPPTGDFSSSLIAGMSQILPEITKGTGIDSIFEVEDFPRPGELPSNDAETVKAWLRAAQEDSDFDHWDGLARVLRPILEDTNSYSEAVRTKIRTVLSKKGVRYLSGGFFTTSPRGETDFAASTPSIATNWIPIGSGGFGEVYRVRDSKLEIDFAWKLFNPYPTLSYTEARARFNREAGLLFRLRHENIVRVYDAGELADGRPFIKMEFFDGFNLYKAREHRSFDSKSAVEIIGRVAAAIEHAHSRSIVHRDVKPSNILLSMANDVRLIDFGLGILVEEAINRARLTKTTDRFGDAFTSPELLENAKTNDPATDIYSLGAVWFWLHAGHAPKGVGAEAEIDSFELVPDLRKLLHSCLLPAGKDRPTAKTLCEGLRLLS